MKFHKDSQRKVIKRVELAWNNAPQQVHQGYLELEKTVFPMYANKYPECVLVKKPSSGQSAEENSLTDAGSVIYLLRGQDSHAKSAFRRRFGRLCFFLNPTSLFHWLIVLSVTVSVTVL